MLIRSHDADADEGRWRAFLAAQGFGHFAAAGIGHDVPVLVPTQYEVRDDEVILHLANSNPVFPRLEENPRALLSVAGDWAYIPAAWKAVGDEDPELHVPTTYYAAVQVIGEVQIIDEPEALAALLRQQMRDLEPDGGSDPMLKQHRFPSIRGIRLSIDEVRAKYKFGGNVDVEHRQAIADKLDTRQGPGDAGARTYIPGVQ